MNKSYNSNYSKLELLKFLTFFYEEDEHIKSGKKTKEEKVKKM